ncbi:MAG TPA: SpoIIE family protein phosphatase [Leptospiraceae bacterium]|nr:SpoIIE family protein phosphatase [Leptospiraceae bacterium]HNF14619.1 SpoIIE family protein phosphatase [Leptospiraceae bacterium]HNF25186.1 SpoIIE family protein phosphatase [Leptospiraceae bacterium]HNI96197.1 SpoIIE family protein phosphatase [Leptospiraceae bacterium]HNN05523.1 SpoIIE family protein phosphatase [Leptospiraceae bacterium]
MELSEARSIISAWEKLFDVLRQEKQEARMIIQAHENLSDLVKLEKKESRNAIEALIEHQRISQDEIQQKTVTLKNILNINRDIISVPGGDVLLGKIVESILHVLNAQRGLLWMKKENGMKFSSLVNISESELQDTSFQASLRVMTDAVDEKKTQIRRFSEFRYGKDKEFIIVIASPLMIQNSIVGVFYMDSSYLSSSLDAIDIDTVEIFSSQIALAIESGVLYEQLETEFKNKTKELNYTNERLNSIIREIKSDMRLAKKIQTKLLPESGIQFQGIQCEIVYAPMFEIGGDIYDIFQIRDGLIRVFLADATGHGIQAALMTTLIKGEFDKVKKQYSSPAEILRILNRNFLDSFRSLNVFFSCIICDINLNLREIVYSSGGHPEQAVLSQSGLTLLPKNGTVIGIRDNAQFKDDRISFRPGSKLILFTDGLFEQFDREMQMFGEDRLSRIFEEMKDSNVNAIREKCFSELKGFLEFENKFHDDITFIGIESL